MYLAIILILGIIAVGLLVNGLNRNQTSRVLLGIIIGVGTIGFFLFMDFWSEKLWFESLGYLQRFWTITFGKVAIAAAVGLISFIIVYILLFSLPRGYGGARLIAGLVGLFFGASFGYNQWDTVLKYFNATPSGYNDPILGKNASFYLFELPFLEVVYNLAFLLLIIIFVAIAFALLRYSGMLDVMVKGGSGTIDQIERKPFRSLFLAGALLFFLLAFGKYLNRFELMFSETGVVHGPGWTDVNIKLMAYNILMVITAITGFMLLVPGLRKRIARFNERLGIRVFNPQPYMIITPLVGVLLLWFIGLTLLPVFFQWFRVEPNEITYESQYIRNNIDATRYGFNLHTVEDKEFPLSDSLSRDMFTRKQDIFQNIRLWDWRALSAVYDQFQEFRLYYEFPDVDIDRYMVDSTRRQVMVAAREMEVNNIPQQSQTFVNERFKYTHGYGITMSTVNDFTSQGLPNMLIKDIPPLSQKDELEVKEPRIYYGELTNTPVVVNSEEEEFDYPSGENNMYNRYTGNGGVQLTNLWRKFLFGWRFDGSKFFFSGYSTSESRILFNRQIEDRVKKVAPFLKFDSDPYVVMENGRLYWMIDAYTTSQFFPYGQPYNSLEQIDYQQGNVNRQITNRSAPQFEGVNYVRNSVKVVVNAYTGRINFYIFDEEDPLIQTWAHIFPDMFKPREEMPDELERHIRYPEDFLLAQGLVYAKYHMNDPAVFYNQEDLWVRATEKYYQNVEAVSPYYVMWELPGSNEKQFSLILPFTPKNRQVLIGWIAGLSDPENYGRFMAYQFPKDRRVLGPQQVETKIDQDSFLSGQLSLWDQRGSNVIRGNVLALPINNSLLYVEPIYLESETAAYPELRLVVLMHNDNISYAQTFDEAISGLFEGAPRKQLPETGSLAADTTERGTSARPQMEQSAQGQATSESRWAQRANQAFEDYLRHTGNQNFEEASRSLQDLRNALNELVNQNQNDTIQ